jgi:PAS domain S-box-containing protein
MSEDEFHGFLEASPDAVIIIDKTGRINFATNRIEAMFGYLSLS